MWRCRDKVRSMGICPRKDARRDLANDLVAAIAHHRGRAYGPDISQRMKEKRDVGNPMVPPTAQVTGINEKARAMFVLSVSSAIILFMTPVFPLSAPCKQRLSKPD